MSYSKRFALLWLALFAACFLLFVAQSWSGVYEGSEPAAWGWFCQTTVPYTTIVFAAILGATIRPMPDRFSFAVTVALACVYYAVLFGTIVAASEAKAGPEAVTWLQKSSLWLAAVQGLAGLIMGKFFGTSKEPPGGEKTT